jgi:hypothetical protein
MTLLATAILLPADALHADQTAAQQGELGKALDGLRAGVAFAR